MVAITPPDREERVREAASSAGVESWVIGHVVRGDSVRIG